MKTATISVLVMYTSLVAFFSMHSVEKAAINSTNENSTLYEDEFDVSFHSSPTQLNFSDSVVSPSKKRYHIFFKNRSPKKLEVAVRYLDESSNWVINESEVLEPGEEQEMGVGYSKTYFYRASSKKGINKKALAVKYQSGLHEDTMTRLGFVKQDIWECYSTDTCNAFAVFE
jgi:hypothetical protein